MFNFINNIGPSEIVLVVILLVFLFGAKAITALGKSSGETVKEIKKIKTEFTKALEIDDDKNPAKTNGRGSK